MKDFEAKESDSSHEKPELGNDRHSENRLSCDSQNDIENEDDSENEVQSDNDVSDNP